MRQIRTYGVIDEINLYCRLYVMIAALKRNNAPRDDIPILTNGQIRLIVNLPPSILL